MEKTLTCHIVAEDGDFTVLSFDSIKGCRSIFLEGLHNDVHLSSVSLDHFEVLVGKPLYFVDRVHDRLLFVPVFIEF